MAARSLAQPLMNPEVSMDEGQPSKPPSIEQRLSVSLAAAGLLLSLWLEVLHYQAYTRVTAHSFCTVGERLDCKSVALSAYSTLLGIPVPVWGIVGFMALGVAAWKRSKLYLPLAVVAALGAVALLGVELAVIGSVCLICEAVHLVCIASLAVAWLMHRKGELAAVQSARSAAVDLAAPAVALAATAFLLPPYWSLVTWKSGLSIEHGQDEAGAWWVGASEPKVTLEEFVDYRCPHCAIATRRTRMLVTAHAGELRVVRRHHPLGRCRSEQPGRQCRAIRVAICAGEQGRFWEMDDWLFAHAPRKHNFELADAASAVGLDVAKLEACVDAPATHARALQQTRASFEHHFMGTPSYLVNGEQERASEVHQAVRDLL